MRSLLAVALSLPALCTAQEIAVQLFALSAAGTNNQSIVTAGPDGALWLTMPNSNQIARVTPAGAVALYPAPAARCGGSACAVYAITAGSDGALWFTSTGFLNTWVGRMTTAGEVTNEYLVSRDVGFSPAIVSGPDGALWFTLQNAIGRLTTSGSLTLYPVPPNGIYQAAPNWITAGPDGALWFTLATQNAIGRITTSGVITEYPIPTSAASANSITAGPDAALWFTEIAAGKIGRITTAGVITEFPLPSGYGVPQWIAPGPDGAMWFTLINVDSLGRISTSGSISQYSVPEKGNFPGQIAPGPDGGLWYGTGASLGEVVFVSANLGASPGTGIRGTKLTFSGSGFAPGEVVDIYAAGFGSPVLASAIADASGAVTATGLATPAVHGPRLFLGKGLTSGKVGAANFYMYASLVLSPSSGPPGTVVTVSGFGFDLGTINVYWAYLTELGSVSVPRHGSFGGSNAFTFTVPADAPPGATPVSAGFSPDSAAAYFDVL